MKKNLIILATILYVFIQGLGANGKAKTTEQPNIIVFVVDDLSYSSLGATGCTKVKTPAIDKVFDTGVRFESGYVTHAVCAPSRAGLMTGRYQARFGYETLSDDDLHQEEIDHGVDIQEIFMAQPLKEAGYTTAAMGKWHLGVNDKYHPNNRGFDYFFGWIGRCDYFNYDYSKKKLLRNKELVKDIKDGDYFTERMATEARHFIENNTDNPFFLYFATNNVHKPHKVPDYYIPKGEHPYYGMVAAADSAMNVIITTLEKYQLDENTLIVVINDNGGIKEFPNANFKGGKATYYEGGIRVPFAMRWPDKLPQGTIYKPMVSSLDIFPTVMEAAGAQMPMDRDYDGINLLPFLLSENTNEPHEYLMWRANWGHAVRYKDWKLIWQRDKKKTSNHFQINNTPIPRKTDLPNYADRGTDLYFNKPELYNLSEDISELNNVVDEHPDIVKLIIKRMDQFDALSGQKQYDLQISSP